MDAAHAGAHLGTQPEQLQADRLDRRIDKLRVPQGDPTQAVDQNMAMPESRSRSWFAGIVADETRSANSSNYSPIRFSASPRAQ